MDDSNRKRIAPSSSARAAAAARSAPPKNGEIAASMASNASPALTLKKKAKKRRSERDESEFVSVEVGMREFQKRLANSKSPATTTTSSSSASRAKSTTGTRKTKSNAAQSSLIDAWSVDAEPAAVQTSKKRARTTTAAVTSTMKTVAAATTVRKRVSAATASTAQAKKAAGLVADPLPMNESDVAARETPTKAPRRRATATAATPTLPAKPRAAKASTTTKPKATTPAKTGAPKTATRKLRATSGTRKATLAEVRAEMLREQQERVELRIQTLHCANCNSVTHAHGHTPAQVALADPRMEPGATGSHVANQASDGIQVMQSDVQHQQQMPPVPQMDKIQFPTPPVSVAPIAACHTSAAPIPSTERETDPIRNKFIDDDFDEDMAFMQALDEVERNLATPTKPAFTLPSPSPPHQHQSVLSPAHQSVAPAAQLGSVEYEPTAAPSASSHSVPQDQSSPEKKAEVSVMPADVLVEFERLKRENERLRHSNELLQAAAAVSNVADVSTPSSMEDPPPPALAPTPEPKMQQPSASPGSSLPMHEPQVSQSSQRSPPPRETQRSPLSMPSPSPPRSDGQSRPVAKRFLDLGSWVTVKRAVESEERVDHERCDDRPDGVDSRPVSTNEEDGPDNPNAQVQTAVDDVPSSREMEFSHRADPFDQVAADPGVSAQAETATSSVRDRRPSQDGMQVDDDAAQMAAIEETHDAESTDQLDTAQSPTLVNDDGCEASQEGFLENEERGDASNDGHEPSQEEHEAMVEDEYETSQEENVRSSTIDRGNYDQYKRHEDDDRDEGDDEEETEDEDDRKPIEDPEAYGSPVSEAHSGLSTGASSIPEQVTSAFDDGVSSPIQSEEVQRSSNQPPSPDASDSIVHQEEHMYAHVQDERMTSETSNKEYDGLEGSGSGRDDAEMVSTEQQNDAAYLDGSTKVVAEGIAEDGVPKAKARLRMQEVSSSDSESDSEDEVDATSNGLEAALQAAAGGGSSTKDSSKPSTVKSHQRNAFSLDGTGSVAEQPRLGDGTIKRKRPRTTDDSLADTTTAVSEKRIARPKTQLGTSASSGSSSAAYKSTLLWPALDDFYEFVLELSPRRIEVPEKHQSHLRRYLRGTLPANYSSLNDYTSVQIEAIMEELAASVRSSEQFSHQNSAKSLYLTSVSPCGRALVGQQSFPPSGQKLNSSAIFMESGFSGTTSSKNDFILTFHASYPGKHSSSADFISGDLILLRSPRWRNYEMAVYGIVLCNSVVAVGGGSGGERGRDSSENDLICVLIRTRDRDHANPKEDFSVLTEMCLANQRSPNWKWRLEQVHNLTTSAREFQAMKSVAFFSPTIKRSLLEGKMSARDAEETDSKVSGKKGSKGNVSPGLYSELERKYNSSQLDAILGCIGEENHVIIQGPPGTGKTKTILGVLSALLDGAAVGAPRKSKESTRIRVGASLKSGSSSSGPKTVAETSIRILVAAPSNAAVDELIVRLLSEGVYDGVKCSSYRPRIVRVGRPESLQQRPPEARGTTDSVTDNKKIKKKWRKYAKEVEEILLENLVTKHKSSFPTTKMARQGLVKNAQIVFCTLSGAGSVAMCDFAQEFDALVIDEAAQAVEASALIPFKFRPNRIILVGDHRQLPATVISKKLIDVGYDRSLFQRFVENGSQVFLLNKQYRMHPDISDFPSRYFYKGKLIQEAKLKDWTARKYHADRLFQPFLFFDVLSGQQSQVSGSKSLRNLTEVEFILLLVRGLLKKYPEMDWRKKIGIIAPYKQQIYELGSHLGRLERDLDQRLEIEVNTVDGFQGREKEIVIYSCVRTSGGGGHRRKHKNGSSQEKLDAFWADERRMNVAITRAKCSLWIIGNSQLLEQSRAWRALIRTAKDRNRYILNTDVEL